MSAGQSIPELFSRVHWSGEESRTSPDYFYDNSTRRDPNFLIVQRTLAGAVFFKDAMGRRLAPAGYALLFTNQEPSSYGYPPEAVEPYSHRYLAIWLGGGVQLLFDCIRKDFGAVVRMSDSGEAAILFDEIFTRFRAHTFRDRFHEAELLHRLMIALYREQTLVRRIQDPVGFGHDHLRDHFRAPLNLKTLAVMCGVSREHLGRQFRERYAESPGALLRRLRLEHARELLRDSGFGIEEIALASGFTGSNSFCRAYRRHFNRSPGQDRGKSAVPDTVRGS